MSTKQDLKSLTEAYQTIAEMNLGPAGAGLQPVGKPVIVTMGVPTSPTDNNCEGEEEHDSSEIEMAAADLHKIAEYAPKLQSIVSQMPNLEGWVAAKITKASDYISSVYHWLEYQEQDGGNCSNANMFSVGHEDSVGEYLK
jgi:hypothetical protein